MRGSRPIRFGSMPPGETIVFSGGEVRPMPDAQATWDQELGRVNPRTRRIHAPIIQTVRGAGREGEANEPVPGSRRVAEMYFAPPTHELHLRDADAIEDSEEYPALLFPGFLVYLVGFLNGFRVQLEPWKLLGDRPGRRAVGFHATASEVARVLDRGAHLWIGLGDVERRRLFNVLFQVGRLGSMQHEWDDFGLSYAILDACFALEWGRTKGVRSKTAHAARPEWMCERLDMAFPGKGAAEVKMLVRHRNELVHELAWGGQPLGFGHPPGDEYVLPTIHALVQRVVLGVLGIRGGFVATEWWGRGALSQHMLDLPR